MSYLHNDYVTNLLINDNLFPFSFCNETLFGSYFQGMQPSLFLYVWFIFMIRSPFPVPYPSSVLSVLALTGIVSFVLACWYNPVFWIYRKNSANSTTMFLLLPKQCYSESRTFQVPTLCQWAGAQETRRKHRQDVWFKLAKSILHPARHRVQSLNWRDLAGSH